MDIMYHLGDDVLRRAHRLCGTLSSAKFQFTQEKAPHSQIKRLPIKHLPKILQNCQSHERQERNRETDLRRDN